MHRIKKDMEYYTFAGGGVDDGETFEECTVREVFEEFGINVKIDKLIYDYESKSSIQKFYLTSYIDGEFGSGSGEEFSGNIEYGKYIPEMIDIDKISKIDLKPESIKEKLIENINKNGINIEQYKNRIDEYDEY